MSSSVSVIGGRLSCDRRSRLSSDAQIVWNALVKKNEQRVSSQATSGNSGEARHHDSSTYYKALYQERFGASLPDVRGTSSELTPLRSSYGATTKWNDMCTPSQSSTSDGIICLANSTQDTGVDTASHTNPSRYQRTMFETPDSLIDFGSETPVKLNQFDRFKHGSFFPNGSAKSSDSSRTVQGQPRSQHDSVAENSYLHRDAGQYLSTPCRRHNSDIAETLSQSFSQESVSLPERSVNMASTSCWQPFTRTELPAPPRVSNDLCTRTSEQNNPLKRDNSDFGQINMHTCSTVETAQSHGFVRECLDEREKPSADVCKLPRPVSPPRMGPPDHETGTFSLSFLSQFTDTQCCSPPLDLSSDSNPDDFSDDIGGTAGNPAPSSKYNDISTIRRSCGDNKVTCSDTLNRLNHGRTEGDCLNKAKPERRIAERICLPGIGQPKGLCLKEPQSRDHLTNSTKSIGNDEVTDRIVLPSGTPMESSLKKVTNTLGKRKTSRETPADVDLRTLEYFLDGSGNQGGKKAKKCSYNPPTKRDKTKEKAQVGNTETSSGVKNRGLLCHVDSLSGADTDRLVECLRQTPEVALSLVYTNGYSQLREPTDTKRRNIVEDKVAGIAMAYSKHTKTVCTDTDTTSRGGIGRTPSNTDLQFAYIPLDSTQGDMYAWSRCVLEDLMTASHTRKMCFDGQDLIRELVQHFDYNHSTVSTRWQVLDVKIVSWLLDPDKPAATFTDIVDQYPKLKQLRQDSGSSEDLICSDLGLLPPVTTHLRRRLENAALWDLFEKIEMPLCPLLAVMELRGICIDTTEMIRSGQVLKKKAMELEKAIHKAAGRPFVITSNPQLRQILFDELKLDRLLPPNKHVVRTLVKQEKSTSEAVLTSLQDVHPLPALILQYRQVQKLKSTYVDSLLGFVSGAQLRTHWDHTAAATGRLTSTDPNIQAIPKVPLDVTPMTVVDGETESVSVYARAPFISRHGYSLLSADFKQIEFRLLAHLSRDPGLLATFNNATSGDIFRDLTSQWLGKKLEEITEKEREQTKRVVYSVMYGAGKERLSEYLKISPEEAKCIMDSFLVMFPGVNHFTRKCIEEARAKGYQETIFRRRRQLPHIHHRRAPLRAHAERQAVNFCVQGSAADLCKAAMLQVEQALATRPQSRLLVQIHDELLLEVPDEEVDAVAEVVRGIMQSGDDLCHGFTKLRIPLQVSVHVGKSWAHMNTWCPTT